MHLFPRACLRLRPRLRTFGPCRGRAEVEGHTVPKNVDAPPAPRRRDGSCRFRYNRSCRERRQTQRIRINMSDRHEIFGRSFECICGRTHDLTPREIIYAENAVARMPEICARHSAGRTVAVLMDARTANVAGRETASALAGAGWHVDEVLIDDQAGGGWPICDRATHDSLSLRLGAADLIVAVGSGVISDLGKWAAFEADVPAVTFATAASMNGYTSANVAPAVDGVKTLVRARPPVAVVAAPAVFKAAPYEMTAAGMGDVLAKSVSSADWLLNHLLFGDYYCEKSVGLIAEIEPLYLDHSADVRRGRDRALGALFDALLLTGAAMTMAETSAPASGGEHMISHTLDMMSGLDGRAHDLHGRQVGVGTILAAELYQRVLAIESPDLPGPPAAVDRRFWGRLSSAVEGHFFQKIPQLRRAQETLRGGGAWDELRRRLAELVRGPERIHNCLSAAGGAIGAEDIGCSSERLLTALLHAHEIRSRFTVLDLARIVGVMPAAAGGIVDAWA